MSQTNIPPAQLSSAAHVTLNVPGQTSNYPHSTKSVRVLHLINGEHFSGAERVQDLLAMAIPEFGYQIGFACVKPDKFPQVRQSRGSELFETKMYNKFDIFCAGRVAKVFRQHNFQLLHAHTPRTLLIGSLAARRLGCPLVYHVHSPVGRDSERGWANQINTWIESWSLKQVDRMICVSSSLSNYMKELGHAPEKIRVVCNGVPSVDSMPKRSDPSETWTIGTMALFRPRKGTEVLLSAMAKLKSLDLPIRLRAVGPFETEDYKKEILNQVDRLGVGKLIDWTGFQKDVDSQLQQMDLFVLPSLYGEGLPMVVLEAMANGVPVVASRVEGIPEAIRDQQDGLIFEPGNADDLAEKLANMIGDTKRWREMRASALKRQKESLSDTSMAKGVAQVYDELVCKKN